MIIPAHWELIRAKEAGRPPDPAPGLEAKRRSVHNNYLTLPVVFAMLAGHFPLTYGHSRAWLVLVAVIGVLVLVRHVFNLRHTGVRAWWAAAAAAAGVIVLAVVLEPDEDGARKRSRSDRGPGLGDRRTPLRDVPQRSCGSGRPAPRVGRRRRRTGRPRRDDGADARDAAGERHGHDRRGARGTARVARGEGMTSWL